MTVTTSLETNGYVHLKDVFTRKSIEILRRYFLRLEYQRVMHYDIVEEGVYVENISGGIGNVLKCKVNDHKLETTFGEIVEGSNQHANSFNREVYEIIPENVRHVGNHLVTYSRDSRMITYARIFSEDSSLFYRDLLLTSKKYIENIVNMNKVLHPYLSSKYKLITARIFFNHPGCKTQEIHTDDSGDVETLVLIIPLTDFDVESRTTVIYVDRIVDEHTKKKSLGQLETLSSERKMKFMRAAYRGEFQVGDVVMYKSTNYHQGTENTSDRDRIFVHLILEKASTIT